MTENQALHPDANDLENNFLKNNSRKKTYAEVIQATTMEDSSCDKDEDDLVDHSDTERSTDQQTPREGIHPEFGDGHILETWEIQITPKLKN